MEVHDFFKLMAAVRASLARDYSRIRRRSKEDPGTAGDQAEEDWAKILRNWLPALYPVVTKGRILFEDGSSSPQVDLLVLKPSYPLGLRSEKYIFAGGVLAAFECKLTLRAEHVDQAFSTAAIIKRKANARVGTPYDELNNPPIFGLLAHSHNFSRSGASQKLHEAVEKFQTKYAQHPRELLDIICVADTAALPLGKHLLMGKGLTAEEREELRELEAEALIVTMYTINEERENTSIDLTGTVLASLVNELTMRLAFEDTSIRPWSDHLARLGVYGGIGRPVYWTADDLSATVRAKLSAVGRDSDYWSKWCGDLP